MNQYIGIDLAWGEGSATKQARETGLAEIDERGRVVSAGWARGIDAVVDWIVRTARPGAVIAVDAPLVIPNASGMRLAERQVGMGYGRWKVSANASNMQMGWQGGIALRTRLEEAGFVYTSGVVTAEDDARTFFECYPYTTMVGMSELGFDDERPRYKRLDKSMPVALGRQQRARACDDLVGRMSRLTDADPPLDIRSHAVARQLTESPSPIDDVPYKHREDLLDALLCAWTAAIWHQHGEARTQVLGEDDKPDSEGRVATIVAPARREQRVRGRVMRAVSRSGAARVVSERSAVEILRAAASDLDTLPGPVGDRAELLDAQFELQRHVTRLLEARETIEPPRPR